MAFTMYNYGTLMLWHGWLIKLKCAIENFIATRQLLDDSVSASVYALVSMPIWDYL